MSDDFTVESFDSFEEMQQAFKERHDRAMERISEDQWSLADGKKHWFVTPFRMKDDQILIVWGWTWDWDEDSERIEKLEPGEDKEESKYENRMYRESLTRGYVFTNSFSVVEPEGELGSHHVSRLIEITEKEFEAGRRNEWNPTISIFMKLEAKRRSLHEG